MAGKTFNCSSPSTGIPSPQIPELPESEDDIFHYEEIPDVFEVYPLCFSDPMDFSKSTPERVSQLKIYLMLLESLLFNRLVLLFFIQLVLKAFLTAEIILVCSIIFIRSFYNCQGAKSVSVC